MPANTFDKLSRGSVGKIPPEVESAVRGCSEFDQLKTWGIQAATTSTLDEFRKAAGI
jgi:hypothetical protein